MSATIKDIARETGLALATISKYINGGTVRPQNKKQIDEAIRKLNYVPRNTARGLRSSKTYRIGLVSGPPNTPHNAFLPVSYTHLDVYKRQFLIWGIGFFPKLGIRGAALATGIGQVLTIAVYMVFYILKPIPVRVTPKALKTSKVTDLSLYAIGVPAILNLALPSFLISFLNSVLAAYSDSYVVILGIYYKLQTFLYLPANGIIQGMRPLIGYNFGAREMKLSLIHI